MKEKEYEGSIKIVKEIKMMVNSTSSNESLKSVEDIVLKGDYEKLFTKEQTSNYVVVEKVKKKPQFCSKRRGFVFLKKWW